MTKPKAAKTNSRLRRRRQQATRLIWIVVILVVALALGWQIQTNQPNQSAHANSVSSLQTTRLDLLHQVELLTTSTDQLQNRISIGDMTALKAQLSQIRNIIINNNYDVARIMLEDFGSQLQQEQNVAAKYVPPPIIPPPTTLALGPGQIPILIYHKPPADLEAQLQALQAKGYTTVKMWQVAAHLHGDNANWPAKPVALTFDDGFADQMSAFVLLQKYHMVATFYLIVGHPTLGFCLGLNQDKSAPCADSYLTWDQAKTLLASGLVEIGDHTMDHLDLSKQTATVQKDQILQAKSQLESRLGISIAAFAYPYGLYNDTTISILASHGFTNAVTTQPTMNQSQAGIFTLGRVRTAFALP